MTFQNSDIIGSGYGASHAWKYVSRALDAPGEFKRSDYVCITCGAHFQYCHDTERDVFAAIKAAGISDLCADPNVLTPQADPFERPVQPPPERTAEEKRMMHVIENMAKTLNEEEPIDEE